jgi:Xaa-Pro aminopeptidase
VDWGARAAGYCSDLTRVVFTGTISPKVAEMYEVVLAAQQAAVRAIRPGLRCGSADAAAREVIRQAGFGERFVHGLGHGIGRRIHEPPALARGQEAILRAGMIVTVEPGVYVPGLGGVRIEDNVLVTPRGARRLSRLPRRLEQACM